MFLFLSNILVGLLENGQLQCYFKLLSVYCAMQVENKAWGIPYINCQYWSDILAWQND